MVASNLNKWMVAFAIDLTSIDPRDVDGRGQISESYKASLLECGIVPFYQAIEIDLAVEDDSEQWVEPADPICIDVDCETENGCEWDEPGDVTVIDNDPLYNLGCDWVQPLSSLTIDGTGITPHGVWSEPPQKG